MSSRIKLKIALETDHMETGTGRPGSLIALIHRRAIPSLVAILHRKKAEAHGKAKLLSQIHNTTRTFPTDNLVMAGLAPDNTAQHYVAVYEPPLSRDATPGRAGSRLTA